MSYIQLVQNYLYGNAYSAQPDDDITEGGYACFSKYPNGQRVWLNGVSAIINVYILYLTYSTVKCQSRECDPRLVKHVKPNLIEKICGAMSLCVLITQICYKTYQKKAIFMLNLCHQTLFLEAYLLLLPKTRKSGLVFICYMTWLCGSYMAVFFPNTTGLNMPYEIELFWLEHILICIGPMLLIYSGRYGFYKESLWMTVKKQYFGMACALIIQRFVIGPTAILTWVNLNYMICPNTSKRRLPAARTPLLSADTRSCA